MKATALALCVLTLFSNLAYGQSTAIRSNGQVLYLPIYSHIWHGDVDSKARPKKTLVSVSVSIRNTDTRKTITVTSAQYFDTDGKRLREYITTPKTIGPMGTFELFVPRSDDAGGSGANFLITWKSDANVNVPVVEALHVDLPAGRAIVFTTTARPISVD